MSSNFTKTFCVFLTFVFVSFIFSYATASPSLPSDAIQDKCDLFLFAHHMTNCLYYLGKGSQIRRSDHPDSSCCSVVRDAWNVDPMCVNVSVLESFILNWYFEFDMDRTRVAQVTSACGIIDGSAKPSQARPLVAASPLEARPPVAASPLEARPPVAASPLSLA